jgi:hypothetical protein
VFLRIWTKAGGRAGLDRLARAAAGGDLSAPPGAFSGGFDALNLARSKDLQENPTGWVAVAATEAAPPRQAVA